MCARDLFAVSLANKYANNFDAEKKVGQSDMQTNWQLEKWTKYYMKMDKLTNRQTDKWKHWQTDKITKWNIDKQTDW